MSDNQGKERVEPEEVIRLYEEEDRSQYEVADALNCSQPYVSRILSSAQIGQESVSLDDFSEEERRASLDLTESVEGDGDDDPDLDPAEDTWTCSDCGAEVEEGTNPCPSCGARFNWEAV